MISGPRRLRDDPGFLAQTGVDLAAEAETLAPHDVARLKGRVMGAVARGQAPRLSPTGGGPGLGLGHWVALIAVGGALAGAIASGGAPDAPVETREAPVAAVTTPERTVVASVEEAPVRVVAVATPEPVVAPWPAAEPIWTEVARDLPAPPAPPARPRRRVTRRPAAPPMIARLEVSPPMVERLALPPLLTLALHEEAEPTSVASLRAPLGLEKDLLGALAETVRRKTFK